MSPVLPVVEVRDQKPAGGRDEQLHPDGECIRHGHNDTSGLRPRGGIPSQHFEYAVDRSIRPPVADADSDDAVEPVVFPLGGLEQWIDAKVMSGRLNHFAPLDPLNYLARSVADSPVGHRDENTINRPQDQSDVQRR
jgi:hypothetical protein